MHTILQRSSGLGMLACVMLVAACQQTPPSQVAEGESEDVSGEGALAGNWRWVSSTRAGEIIQPTTPSDSMVFQIGPYGGYREQNGDSQLSGHYWFVEGHLYQLQDSIYVVLLLDSSNFFPRTEQRSPTVAIRSLDADSLLLSGTGTDATFHRFVRVAHEW